MKRKALLGMLVVIFGLGAMATQVSANVIPGNPRVGDPATTRMWCFQGTVTFTLVGPGVAIVVGTTTATPMPEGKAEVNFTVPNVPAGYYTMVGTGTGCDGKPSVVNVGFVIRPANGGGGGPQYPPGPGWCHTDKGSVRPHGRVKVSGGYFKGPVHFTLGGESLGTSSPGDDGTAEYSFTAPEDSGDYTVSASGVSADGTPLAVSTSFSVTNGTTITGGNDAAPTTTVAAGATVTVAPAAPATTASAAFAAPTTTVDPIVPVQVLGTTETAAGQVLAKTGGDPFPFLRLSLAAIAVGGVLVLSTRRRYVSR
jgi:hypothetical protein